MSSEYDPLFSSGAGSEAADEEALASVRRRFAEASRPFVSSPVVWVVWALLLPAAALATARVAGEAGGPGVLLLWSGAILFGGLVEALAIRRHGALGRASPLARWALRVQGNLSLVGVALSALFVWADWPQALPGVWLLLLGHSFFTLGGLSFRPMRTAGVVFQLGGAAALWPGGPALEVFAATAAVGCLGMAWGIRRSAGDRAGPRTGDQAR